MTSTVVTIKEIIAKLRRAPQLTNELADTADLVDGLALDSLELLQFMLELEERLSIRIDFDRLEFSYLRSISKLADFLDTMPTRHPSPRVA
jgi:acyl carrier protein